MERRHLRQEEAGRPRQLPSKPIRNDLQIASFGDFTNAGMFSLDSRFVILRLKCLPIQSSLVVFEHVVRDAAILLVYERSFVFSVAETDNPFSEALGA